MLCSLFLLYAEGGCMMEHKRVCVIAVHPDDETLGCGGTILKHISNDDEVICVFVTAGNRAQRNLISTASKAYNFTKVLNLICQS